MNSKNKGKRGELELANLLKKQHGFETRRGQQYSGLGGKDIVGLERIHAEVKRVERLNIYKAMEQAFTDSKNTGEVPCVFHRKNHYEWLVTLPLKEWVDFYKAWLDWKEADEKSFFKADE